MNQLKLGIAFMLLIFSTACSGQKETIFEKYKFEIKGFDWDPVPYKFSSFIKDSVSQNLGAQYAGWDYSYIGDIEKMLKTWDSDSKATDTLSQNLIANFKTFERVKAKPVIIEKANKAKVVIINEAHQMPQHRVFTTELLQELYDEGYRHLGMEALFSSKKADSTLVANKYPILTNGYYVREPQFGNLIRTALKIGYKVFGYESQGHSNSKEREINQAKNIQEYIDLNPNEKYLIHCGFDHAAEGIYGGTWEKTMAGRLTEFTGINPLTINQTKYSEKSQRKYENPYYQLTDVEEPSIYVRQDSIFGKYREGSWFDISIFHPRTKNFDRADWLLTGNRTISQLNFENAAIECPCLVFVYLEGEEIGKAIPYDIQETKNKEVKLVLEKGKYNVVLTNENGESLLAKIEN